MTLTKAELTRIIESADEVITALAGTNDDIHPDNSTKMCAAYDYLNDVAAPPAIVKKLAELALAGMEAEAVGFIARHKETGKFGSYLHPKADRFKDDNYEVLKAYDGPQPLTTSERSELENCRNAQQVVPEPLAGDIDADDHPLTWSYHNGWNACRAAMLQGAEPVTTAYKLPELSYLDIVKFNADCALQNPESIYAQEFFMSLDEVFGERGNYTEPVQAKAVSILIAEIFRLRGYPAAPQQEAE